MGFSESGDYARGPEGGAGPRVQGLWKCILSPRPGTSLEPLGPLELSALVGAAVVHAAIPQQPRAGLATGRRVI